MDMKWLDNLISVFACGETGVCPYCGSPDTDHGFTVIKKTHAWDMGLFGAIPVKGGFISQE